MRAYLLFLVCSSAAVACASACHGDATSPERSVEAQTKQEQEANASDNVVTPFGPPDVRDARAANTAKTLTTTAGASLARPVSLDTRLEARPEIAREEVTTPGSEISPEAEATHVHYALARHLERAEQWRGDVQLFDFGEPGDAKYTMAGWLGHPLTRERYQGKTTVSLHANNLKLLLPAEREDQTHFTLALSSFGPARLAVYWNSQLISNALIAGEAMQRLSVKLPAGVVKRGDNVVELRMYGRGSSHEPGFALDYAALSSKPQTRPLPTPVSQAHLRPDSKRDRLVLPVGITLGYALEVPARGRWEATLSADETAQLELSVVRDGAPAKVLGTFEAGPNGKHAELDLRAYAGQVLRLQMRAERAEVTLDEPAITAPGAAVSALDTAAERRPIRNVIVYLVDTLRADRLTPYNRKTRVQTPGITRFVETAAVLTNARSQENWTKPSVATLLSSLLPWEHNTFADNAVLPPSVQVLPEILQQQGFNTAAFIANGYVSDKFGFKRGFATYHNYIREGRRCVAQSVAADVIDWLDARPQNKPFFLYVHTIDPHVPYQPPRDYVELYDNSKYEGPINFGSHSALLDEIKVGRVQIGPRDRERLQALYDASVSYHDVYFNVMMNALEQRGLDSDTLVVVTADHGEEFWDHGSVGHGHSLYDELLHVPLLMRVPGVTHAGDRIKTNVGLIDVAPTILEALGIDPPESMTGRSFLPELQGAVADAPRSTVSGFMEGSRSLATGRYKLVQREFTQPSLYDTRLDPLETRDLSNEKPLTLAYLRGLLGLALTSGSGATPRQTLVHDAEDTAIDDNTEQQLRALGYVGGSRL